MVNPTLLAYIKMEMSQGVSKDAIKQNLITGGGWAPHDVDEAFASLSVVSNVPVSPMMSQIPVTNSTPIKYAGFWIRFTANIIDSLCFLAIPGSIVLSIFFLFPGLRANPLIGWVDILMLWAYFVYMTNKYQATLGKMAVGIKVISEHDLGRLSLGKIIVRETIGKWVSAIFFIGYIMAGFTKKKRALHDMFVGSVVIYKDPNKKPNLAVIIAAVVVWVLMLIAILGIFSSIVLVALNTARQQSTDARTKEVLSSMQINAEIYYTKNNNTYSTANNCSSGMFADSSFTSITSGLGSTTSMSCYAEGTTYAISAPLSTAGENYCVDSTGYADMGASATDNGSGASCQTGSSNTGTVSTDAYSLTLPSGWIVAQNGPQGLQALNQSSGYLLSITATIIPSVYGNVTSVDQATTIDELKSSLVKKYPNAVIKSVTTGTIGGKKVYIMNYDMSAADLTGTQNQGQPKQVSITEYTTVDNGSVYTIAFISALSDEAATQSDLQTIVGSFMFKS